MSMQYANPAGFGYNVKLAIDPRVSVGTDGVQESNIDRVFCHVS